VFTGGAIRFRIYSDYGLSAIDVAKICFLSGLTFWLGNAFVLGIGMAWHPWAASAMDQLPAAINRLIALGIIAAIVAYFAWLSSGENRRELGQNGWKVVLPSARLTLLQILIGVVDLGFCAMAMYLLVPEQPGIDFISLAVVFILASLLGWRINARFVHAFFGRVFNHPHAVFTEAMLKPELQDKGIFADGMDNIIATQKRVAKMYFADGSIAQACPPLKALLHIMLNDAYEGKGLEHPEIRQQFTRDYLMASDWYAARLAAKQKIDRALWKRHVEYLNTFLRKPSHEDVAASLNIADRLAQARKTLETVESPAYLKQLSGTLGAEPMEAYL